MRACLDCPCTAYVHMHGTHCCCWTYRTPCICDLSQALTVIYKQQCMFFFFYGKGVHVIWLYLHRENLKSGHLCAQMHLNNAILFVP